MQEVERRIAQMNLSVPTDADRRSAAKPTSQPAFSVTCAVMAVVLFLASAAFAPDSESGDPGNPAAVGLLVMSALALGVIATIQGIQISSRQSARSRVRRFDRDWAALQARRNELREYLAGRQGQFDRDEDIRLTQVPIWHPVGIPPETRTMQVFGGDSTGRGALLVTLGCSLLGSGRRLTVLDFSARRDSTFLEEAAEQSGLDFVTGSVGTGKSEIDPLAGLSIDEAVEVLVTVLREEELNHVDRRDRGEAIYALTSVLRALDPAAPFTVPRVARAIELVLRPDRDDGQDTSLSPEEAERLSWVLSDMQRSQDALTGALTALAGHLRLFPAPLTDPMGATLTNPLGHSDWTPLEILHVPPTNLSRRVLANLAVDAMASRFGRGSDRLGGVVIIVGADRCSDAGLDRLLQACRSAEVLLISIFDRYRGVGREHAGSPGSVQLFLALEDMTEAKAASEQFGTFREFYVSERSTNTSEQWSTGGGTSNSWGGGPGGSNWSNGASMNFGHSGTRGSSEVQRQEVCQYIEQETLTNLGVFQAYMIQRADREAPVFPLDCDPRLAVHPQLGGNLGRAPAALFTSRARSRLSNSLPSARPRHR
jgi:hypothetical protein